MAGPTKMGRFADLPALVLSALLASGCSDMCGNDVIDRLNSPDGKHQAVLFQRDCGATTGLSTQVSILSDGDALDGAGNVFVADDGHGRGAGVWGGPWAEIRWQPSGALLVRYAAGSHIFNQSALVSGVAIQFEAVQNKHMT